METLEIVVPAEIAKARETFDKAHKALNKATSNLVSANRVLQRLNASRLTESALGNPTGAIMDAMREQKRMIGFRTWAKQDARVTEIKSRIALGEVENAWREENDLGAEFSTLSSADNVVMAKAALKAAESDLQKLINEDLNVKPEVA